MQKQKSLYLPSKKRADLRNKVLVITLDWRLHDEGLKIKLYKSLEFTHLVNSKGKESLPCFT